MANLNKWTVAGTMMAVFALTTFSAISPSQAASYSAITVPGSLLGDNWTVTKNLLSKNGDGTWSGTFTTTTNNGEFKFAANKDWTVNWGGASDLVIARLPATGPLAQGGSNIGVKGVPTGTAVTFTFNDSALAFDLAGAASAGANLQSAQVVGAFNSFGGGSTAGIMTETTSGLWEADVPLPEGTTIQLLVKPSGATTTERWGPPYAQMVEASATEALGWSMCGSSTGTLSVAASGKYHFTFDEETLMLYVAAPLAAVTLPGDLLGEWSDLSQCPLANNGDGLWTGTYPTITNNGAFKIAANNSWDINWGGPTELTITRLPATGIGPLVQNGGNIFVQGQPTGTELTFNFDETTKTCDVLGTAASAGANLKSAQVIGDFNNYGGDASVGAMTRGSDGVWTADVTLGAPTAIQLKVKTAKNATESWGTPYAISGTAGLSETAVFPLCGNSGAMLEFDRGGVFHFAFDEETLQLTVTQTSIIAFEAAGMSVDGNWQGPSGLANGANLVQAGKSYSASFWVTNASGTTLTLLFSERNEAGATGGLYYGYSTGAAMSPASLSAGYSGTAVASSDRSALQPFQLRSAGPGMYEVTFNKTTLGVTVNRKYAASGTSKVNLLGDPSFEQMDDNEFPTGAGAWGYWNARLTTNGWHSGRGAGFLSRLAASDDQTHGGLTYDVAVASNQWGATFRLSAYFKKTSGWSDSANVLLQIEWRKPATTEPFYSVIGTAQADVMRLKTWNWTYSQLEAEVPEGATSAHAVIMYNNGGESGAVLVDDAELRVSSSRTQTFDTWTPRLNSWGAYSPDWEVDVGKTVDNLADLDLGPGGVFFARYVEGSNNNKALEIYNAGETAVNLDDYQLVFYTNGSKTISATNTIQLAGTLAAGQSFVISQEAGYFPTNMDPAAAIIAASDMQTNRLTFNGDDVVVLMKGTNFVDRIGQVGANDWTSFNAFVMRDHTLVRHPWQRFGTTNAVTDAWPLWDEWEVEGRDEFSGLGEFEPGAPPDLYVPSGLSLVLRQSGAVQTPPLDGGVGDVTFWYRAATATNTTAGKLVVETSADGITWKTIATLAVPATDTAWQSHNVNINDKAAAYLRLRSDSAATGLVRIDDVTVAAAVDELRTENFEKWTTESWSQYHNTYNLAGWTLVGQIATNNGGLCAKLVDGDSITSPLFGEGGAGDVILTITDSTTNSSAGSINVLYSTNGTDWVSLGTTLTANSKGLRTNAAVNVQGAVAVRFVATVEEGQSLFADNLQIRIFEGSSASRVQPFETWANGGYAPKSGEGWSCSSGYVETREGTKVLRMNSNGSTLVSPVLSGGIGTLTFRACGYGPTHDPTFTVSGAPSAAGPWTNLHAYAIAKGQTNLVEYSLAIQDESITCIKFERTNDKILVLDDINAGVYKKPGNIAMVPGITPDPPPMDANYKFTGSIQPIGEATIQSVQMVSQIKPVGQTKWKPAVTNAMAYDATAGLYLSGALLPQATNTTMQYWLRVTWSTVNGTATVTQTSLSSTNETVFSPVAGGRVWINEIAYRKTTHDEGDPDDWLGTAQQNHEYIEICGPAGTDISGWTVHLMLTRSKEITAYGQQTYATYVIPANTRLRADTTVTNATGSSSYGFYVIGDDQSGVTDHPLANVDLTLTNLVPSAVNPAAVDENDHIHYQGMVQLKTRYRALVDTLVYGATFNGQNAGSVIDDEDASLGASGKGAASAEFEWEANDFTPGETNVGQELKVTTEGEATIPVGLFHEARRKVVGGLETFYMIDTKDGDESTEIVDMRKAVRFYVGGPAAVIPSESVSGVLHIRQGTVGAFTPYTMDFALGAGDGTNNFLFCTAFQAGELTRLDTLQYYFEVRANPELYLSAFVGVSSNNPAQCATYALEDDAIDNPFTFVVPFPDFADEDFLIEEFTFDRDHGTATVTFHRSSTFAPGADEIALQSCTDLAADPQVWTALDADGESHESSEGRLVYNYTFFPPTTNGTWAIRLTSSPGNSPTREAP